MSVSFTKIRRMIVCKEKAKRFCTFVTLKMAGDFVMVKRREMTKTFCTFVTLKKTGIFVMVMERSE